MSLFKPLSCFCLVVVMLTTLNLFAADKEATRTVVRFCVPQNNVYPFVFTEKGILTGINPDIMRQVFNENTLKDATLRFVKRPWKRCNADLENGTTDMMVGGFDAKRENVVYPSKLGFDLNDSAISTAEVCFASVTGIQLERARRGMEGRAPFIVGIQAGFSKQHSRKIKPQWVELFNPIEKYRMLEKGRVDAITQVCAMDGDYRIESKAEAVGFSNVETLYPPYLSNPAYVVFSENFAGRHNELAKRIISVSRDIDKTQVYSRYQPKANK